MARYWANPNLNLDFAPAGAVLVKGNLKPIFVDSEDDAPDRDAETDGDEPRRVH